MKQFAGFPAKTEFTPVPNPFFTTLLPEISDIAELKTTLHLLGTLYRKRGYPRFVTYRELLANRSLLRSIKEGTKPVEESLRHALEMATKRGTVLHLILDRDGVTEDVYFLNTERDREIVAKIEDGELSLPGLKAIGKAPVDTEEQPNIFTLYEENIGMLTPMIAEELRQAEMVYPEGWIRDAIKEATKQQIHKWSYISAILESWAKEGKGAGTYKRDLKKTDPDKYIKGKYGHMVRR